MCTFFGSIGTCDTTGGGGIEFAGMAGVVSLIEPLLVAGRLRLLNLLPNSDILPED
jgi:hypothetical protein